MDALLRYELGRVKYLDSQCWWAPIGEVAERIEPLDLEDIIRDHVESRVIYGPIDLSNNALTADLGGADIASTKLMYDILLFGESKFESDSMPIIGGVRKILVDNGAGIYDTIEQIGPFILIDVCDGLDSHHAEVRSLDGRVLVVEYGVSLEQQLSENDMFGDIMIRETTRYGRVNEYHVHMSSPADISGTVSFIDGGSVHVSEGITISGDLPVLTIESQVGWMSYIYPEHFIQDGVTHYENDIYFDSGRYVVEIHSTSGFVLSFIIDSHAMDVSAEWDERSIEFSCELCEENHVIEANLSTSVIHKPTCTGYGREKDILATEIRGQPYQIERTRSTAATGHDYDVEYFWSQDGSTCDVTFCCENDPANHSGSFTVYSEDIESERHGETVIYTLSGVVEGVRLNSSHTVVDETDAPPYGYIVAIVAIFVGPVAIAALIRRIGS